MKLGTHVDSGQMYCVYQNQVAVAYSSLYFFSFLSLQFSNIKKFCCTFLRKNKAYKVDSRYTGGQWWMYCVYHNQAAASYLAPYFFLSKVQKFKIFVTFFSGTVKSKTEIRLLLLICPFIGPFFFLFNSELQICLSPQIAL